MLLYPDIESGGGTQTLVSVTNRNDGTEYCENSDSRIGDVVAHFVYIDGDDWTEFDRFEYLTPGDTFSAVASMHAPEIGRGFLCIIASDVSSIQDPIAFDHLMGSVTIVDSALDMSWSYTPYAFRSIPQSEDPCFPVNPDALGDADGAVDFDGVEYRKFPAMLWVDSFLLKNTFFTNRLTLMTTVGPFFSADTDFLFWNNIEQKFSRSFQFYCWWSGPLNQISRIAEDLGGDLEETGIVGLETGWVSIRPSRILDSAGNPQLASDGSFARPPVLGIFAETSTVTEFSAGRPLHYDGTLDGLELFQGDGDPQQP